MPKTPEDYLKEPYSRILIPNEGGGYSAEILEFPGCFAEGGTADEAMRNLEQAAISWIDAAVNQGQEIPEPYMNQGYGGRIALRLPRSLHRQAVRLAERDGVSLNQFLVSAIAERVGARDCFFWLRERLKEHWNAHAQTIQNVAVNAICNLNFSIPWTPQSQVSNTFQDPHFLFSTNLSVQPVPIAEKATTGTEEQLNSVTLEPLEAGRNG
jgi:predicted RNase H-like HicB family nuclease